jgi:hypothetical protein
MGMPTFSIHHCGSNMHEEMTGAMIAGKISVLGSLLGSTLFGAIRCAPWNFGFPTHTEQLLWRIAYLVIMVLPLPSLVSFGAIGCKSSSRNVVGKETRRKSSCGIYRIYKRVANIVTVMIVLVYFLCEFHMLAEVVRALFFFL